MYAYVCMPFSADGDPSGAFVLDLVSGEFGTMRPLDQEVEPAFHLRIEAQDRGEPALSATLLVIVTVLDANDHAPAFPVPAYSVEVPEDAAAGTLLLQLQAHDPDAGANGHVTYYLGAGATGAFLLEPGSGELRTATALDREQCPSYAFSVSAVDGAAAGPLSTTVSVTITVRDVNDHAPTFPALDPALASQPWLWPLCEPKTVMLVPMPPSSIGWQAHHLLAPLWTLTLVKSVWPAPL